jgi:hypothetical protein
MKVSSQSRAVVARTDEPKRGETYIAPAIIHEGKISVRAITGEPLGVGPGQPFGAPTSSED